MARGGAKPGERRGGRKKGSLNKATIARLEREGIERQIRAEITTANQADAAASRHRAKEVLEEFLPLLRGRCMAVWKKDEARFKEWFSLLLNTASCLIRYQSPSFRAVHMAVPYATRATETSRALNMDLADVSDDDLAVLERFLEKLVSGDATP